MNEIFVFGSNLAGRHGKGAAKYALEHFGAKYGQGTGLQGNSYAIPTKDEKLKPLKLNIIQEFVTLFLNFAHNRHDLEFHVTAIGCGLAGYKHEQIAPMFRNRPSNVLLPIEFLNVLRPKPIQ